MMAFAATLAANSCPCPRGSWRSHEACPAAKGLATTFLGLVRDTSGHVMLAVRTVNDHGRWPCGAGAHADCAVARSGPGIDQDCSDTSQTVPELLTKFGSDGWELGRIQVSGTEGTRTAHGRSRTKSTTSSLSLKSPGESPSITSRSATTDCLIAFLFRVMNNCE